MATVDTFEKLLAYAVSKEEEAAAFYEYLAAESKQQNIKRVFLDFAAQEKEHRKAFARLVEEGCSLSKGARSGKGVANLAEYLVDIPFDPNMSYQDTLILAMKREEKAEALYRALAAKVADKCMADTILKLAEQEAAHKAKLESIYERDILTED